MMPPWVCVCVCVRVWMKSYWLINLRLPGSTFSLYQHVSMWFRADRSAAEKTRGYICVCVCARFVSTFSWLQRKVKGQPLFSPSSYKVNVIRLIMWFNLGQGPYTQKRVCVCGTGSYIKVHTHSRTHANQRPVLTLLIWLTCMIQNNH